MAGEVGDDFEVDQQRLVREEPSVGAACTFTVGELCGGERRHHRAECFRHGVDDPGPASGRPCLGVTCCWARTETAEELVEGAAEWCEPAVFMCGGCYECGRVGRHGQQPTELA